MKSPLRNTRLNRWLVRYLEVNVTLRFIKGEDHKIGDICSRTFAHRLAKQVRNPRILNTDPTLEEVLSVTTIGQRQKVIKEQQLDDFCNQDRTAAFKA